MTIGTAVGRLNAPEPTKATIIEVLVELLWMTAVSSKPMNKPINGLAATDKIDVPICSRSPENEYPRRRMASRKRATATTIVSTLLATDSLSWVEYVSLTSTCTLPSI